MFGNKRSTKKKSRQSGFPRLAGAIFFGGTVGAEVDAAVAAKEELRARACVCGG